MRIQREIPREEIARGEKAGNLRQIIQEEMKKRHLECHCIRCREAGHRVSHYNPNLQLKRIDYQASGGTEIFLSYEENDGVLHGFLRLRIPSGGEFRPELRDKKASLVRELHVYGPVVPLDETTPGDKQSQHRGIGTRLLLESEQISKEFSRSKIVVISAVGTREYYRKRGYCDDGTYVSKTL